MTLILKISSIVSIISAITTDSHAQTANELLTNPRLKSWDVAAESASYNLNSDASHRLKFNYKVNRGTAPKDTPMYVLVNMSSPLGPGYELHGNVEKVDISYREKNGRTKRYNIHPKVTSSKRIDFSIPTELTPLSRVAITVTLSDNMKVCNTMGAFAKINANESPRYKPGEIYQNNNSIEAIRVPDC